MKPEPRLILVPSIFKEKNIFVAEISKANNILQLKPTIDFEKGIELLEEWYKNYKSELWLY